jgi:ornithine cyclodeaminase
MVPEFAVIGGRTVHRIVHSDLAQCVRLVREVYLTHHRGDTVNPASHFLRFPHRPDARIIALPAHLGGEWNVSGIKWIASFPANVQQGIPRASAVLILNRPDTGYPYACLESSVISAARTAASAVLAAEALRFAGRRARSIALIGTGFIAGYVHRFLAGLGWRCDSLGLYDTDSGRAARFADGVLRAGAGARLAGRVDVAPTVDALIAGSDLVVFTTTATAPHIHDPGLFAHAPLVLHVSLRDLAPAILLSAQNVVDDVDHVLTAGTSAHLAEQAAGHREFITGTLAQVLVGEARVDPERTAIFSPFGMGILDLALGKWVAEQAARAGEVTRIDGFFHDIGSA